MSDQISQLTNSETTDPKGGESVLQNPPLVGVIMGSKSDLPVMEGCTDQLDAMGIPYELKIASAHRKPAEVHDWASSAAERGMQVIIAAAGKAAHLGGVVAAYTPLPVIAVPMKTSDLGGLDSLLSMVQMLSTVRKMLPFWLRRSSAQVPLRQAMSLQAILLSTRAKQLSISKKKWPRPKAWQKGC